MKTLEELQAEDLPRFSVRDSLPPDKVSDHALIERLQEHFSHFLPDRRECPMCDRGAYSLTWALRHGDMVCACGYPATAYHFIEGHGRIVHVLYAHPSDLVTTA